MPKELGAGLKLWLRPEELNNPNRLRWTDDFENAVWTDRGITFTPGQPDPLGGNDATLMTSFDYPNEDYQQALGIQPGTDVACSIYWKRGPGHNGTARGKVHLTDGVSNTHNTGNVVPPAEWERVELTITSDGESTGTNLYLTVDIDDQDQSVLFYGAQLESGSASSPYRANAATAGGLIASWPDQSGNGYNAIQATQAKMFLVVANALDGYAAAMSDGVDDYLRVLTGATTVPWTFYFVVYPDETACSDSNRMYYTGTPTDGSYLRWDKAADKYVAWVPPPTVDSDVDSVEGDSWTAFKMTGVADRVKLKDLITGDEHESMGTLVGNPLKNGVYIGSSTGGSGAFFAGMYIEWIVVDEEVSATDDARMMNYLANKYPSLGI
jgi:hypothetical protein